MRNNVTKIIVGVLALCIAIGLGTWWVQTRPSKEQRIMAAAKKASQAIRGDDEEEHEEEGMSPKERKVRHEYFFRMLRDPATNSIPKNIRARELNYARHLPSRTSLQMLPGNIRAEAQRSPGFVWKLAGPPAVGGRTRALGIDQRNSDIIIAGAVSGGIWKSTDGGQTWEMKTANLNSYSVTTLDQDPTHPDTWYYAAGELRGSSEGAPGAPYFGTGIYKSTDNGETWHRIPSTKDINTQWNSQFDFVERIRVSPTTGTVFVASDGFGIYRSADGRHFNNLVLGGFGQHRFADVAVASDGTVAAVLSAETAGQPGGNPGIFVSHDDGKTWTEITPTSFPQQYARSVMAFAPSKPNILYVFTQKVNDDSNQGVSFYKLNLANNPRDAQDRAGNLPDFGNPVGGINTQGSYNMCIAVKPNDPNFVVVGATNLFRSTDGFSTGPTSNSVAAKNKYWIGGYAKVNNVSQYPNQHPDQHVVIFDPNNPNRLFAGNDGGIQVTNNITATSVSWKSLNKGYIVTQFYDASMSLKPGTYKFVGGTQDNGSPFFTFSGTMGSAGSATDITSGDGAYSFFTKHYIYVSNASLGYVIRYNNDFSGSYNYVHPANADPALFVNPYAVDPNDEGTMYYVSGRKIYRNTQVDEIFNKSANGTTIGWSVMQKATLPGNYLITAISVTNIPSDVLYYAGYSSSEKPVIKRLANASSSNKIPENVSIPNAASGAYIHDLAINPANGDELLAIMTNYNIVGIYHTMDGGETWEAVEGNLKGNSTNPGPSIRSATIIPTESGTIYLVGTSTGVYSTRKLDGANTTWIHESPANSNSGKLVIGYSVVEDITSRFSDGDVAVGSHGRGMFVGRFQGQTASNSIPTISFNPSKARAGDEITITAQNFQFTGTPMVTFAGAPANVINVTPSQVNVTVPSVVSSPLRDKLTVNVEVIKNSGQYPAWGKFTVKPPKLNPKISIRPKEGLFGNKVTITAKNFQFTGTPSVTFAGVSANIANVTSSHVVVTVPWITPAANDNKRTVTINVKRTSGPPPSGVKFNVFHPIKITPDKGKSGDKVTITAKSFQFNGLPKVTFDGTKAHVQKGNSASQMVATVPWSAISSMAADSTVILKIAVNAGSGTNTDGLPFTILPPTENKLKQNFPNPFGVNGTTTIPISLNQAYNVTISIYSVTGQLIYQTETKKYNSGTYNIPIDFSGHASGVYIYRIIAKPTGTGDAFVKAKKFTYIK